MARLQISNNGLRAFGTRIVLNDQDISRDCTGLELVFDVETITQARITINVDHLDVDAQALLMLQAAVKIPKEEQDGA